MRQGNQKTYVCVVCCEREIKIIETDLSRAFYKFGVVVFLFLLFLLLLFNRLFPVFVVVLFVLKFVFYAPCCVFVDGICVVLSN